jgi:hypothetical protein
MAKQFQYQQSDKQQPHVVPQKRARKFSDEFLSSISSFSEEEKCLNKR